MIEKMRKTTSQLELPFNGVDSSDTGFASAGMMGNAPNAHAMGTSASARTRTSPTKGERYADFPARKQSDSTE
ncbi:MAG: hypothetical protein HUU46_07565 [Candidatus Hydrogenedentes bacterium]|nr:hypothetical protein [Candidatus Hydrogenedentota bacterium]